MASRVVLDSILERPNIRIRHRSFFLRYRHRRFSFDIEGKNYDIVPDIVPDIVYINLTCHVEHAGSSLQRHGISDSNDDEEMDDDDLRDYEDQLLEDFSLSQAKGPISKFLADMPAFAIDAE
jgi:hypothetical protein